MVVWRAQQGSSAAPVRPDNGSCSAERGWVVAGAVSPEELRSVTGPRGLRAAEVGECDPGAEVAAPGVSREHRSRGWSISVITNGAESLRDAPSTHSRYAVTDRRLVRGEWFVSVRREILIGSSAGTNCSRSSAMPCASYANRV